RCQREWHSARLTRKTRRLALRVLICLPTILPNFRQSGTNAELAKLPRRKDAAAHANLSARRESIVALPRPARLLVGHGPAGRCLLEPELPDHPPVHE